MARSLSLSPGRAAPVAVREIGCADPGPRCVAVCWRCKSQCTRLHSV